MTNPTPLGTWVADDYDVVAEITTNMPTGLTVSDDDRVFVSFPRWGDDVPFTVAEIIDGIPVAYPNAAVNVWSEGPGDGKLVSVQSVIVAPDNTLWLLDTGAPKFDAFVPSGPKLVQVDLATNEIVRVVEPSADAVTATTYLNDVRFDFSRGAGGYAYITDSQPVGALIIIDLASGESWSRLRGHNSTKATDQFRATVQGVIREGYRVGADGIAISADGSRIYYCPLSSRRLYSVATEALLDRSLNDDAVAATVIDHGDKPASDGLESDAAGGLYMTAYEHSAVVKLDADGNWSTLVHGPAVLWPDTLALAANGHLYVSVNQLPRSPLFNGDIDDRVLPYLIIRTPVDAAPIRLTAVA
ncbi:gluconolaconase [Curtobacterium sp. BH-2-1-1]|uniref:SMP-30/gluconolactonase/LRE family protein n=1 Tax=Curtobacterium sp. BH-2-1-1 TaxID=1905847 RepID=UPI00089DEE06|nr:L-dopachrome tautomerase-related protein [Curtobacterium sp. BH-2-1-1]AOX65177.1 gluconolaconase [Curtobacterium sp. BH-2-1-1]